ncbi:kinase-like domain-containing protein [Suillus discolor]|uniref:Kinase-like domain-containing protein n=1 Tax=Suillus discolor TaxID=1912936 RepID=A0A9P7F760_9AGAM|nr:kinase-like domain-containing protein [Suillus discolor]KAG2108162.1 kinase-like domain-containing protein [Suillus discolor]
MPILPLKALARQVPLHHRPSSPSPSDVTRSSGERQSYLSQNSFEYTSEDGESGRDSISEGGSQLIYLIPTATTKTSTYGLFAVDTSIATGQTNFPTASGGLGDVYRCILNRGASPEEVAAKSLRYPILTDAAVIAKINRKLEREIKIWTGLKHRYILCLRGTATGFGPFRALVSPWMPNGTLNFYLTREKKTLARVDRLRILKQITEGLKYLHDNKVTHGDLTSNNVLIAADGSPRLADFGVSNILVESNPAFSFHNGAVCWAAPELLFPEGETVPCATKSSDIYALGCIMLEVLYSKTPYWWIGKNAVQVVASKYKGQEPINNTVQIHARHLDFMRRCWTIKSESRPSVEDVQGFLAERDMSNWVSST